MKKARKCELQIEPATLLSILRFFSFFLSSFLFCTLRPSSLFPCFMVYLPYTEDTMTQQAELIRKIDKLPSHYLSEVIDFVGYLQHKAQQAAAQKDKLKSSAVRDIELFEKYADELNAEAEDVLSYQNMYLDE
jgi:hypothetical protein